MKPRIALFVAAICFAIAALFFPGQCGQSPKTVISIPMPAPVSTDTVWKITHSTDTVTVYKYKYFKTAGTDVQIQTDTAALVDITGEGVWTETGSFTYTPPIFWSDSTETIYGRANINIMLDSGQVRAWELTLPGPTPCPEINKDSLVQAVNAALRPLYPRQKPASVFAGPGYDWQNKSACITFGATYKWIGAQATWSPNGSSTSIIFVKKF